MALSSPQLIVLAAACQRPDRSIYPLTTKLPGGAAAKVLGGQARGDHLARGQEARPPDASGHPDAFKALGVDEAPAGTEAASSIEGKPELGGSRKAGKSKPKAHGIRADSKQAKLIEVLKAPKGASIEEIVTAFGWQPHTVRGAIAGALKKKLGLNVVSEKSEGRGRIYRIA